MFDRHAEAAGRAFEDGFGDVVVVAAVVDVDVEVAQGVGGQGLPEVFDQLGIELADLLGRERSVEYQVIATAQIPNRAAERFFHRQRKVAVAADSLLVADRLADGLTDADAGVFNRVMLIDVQVALHVDLKVEATVPREQLQHVIEEADAGRTGEVAGAVEVEFKLDLRFGRVAFDLGDAAHEATIVRERYCAGFTDSAGGTARSCPGRHRSDRRCRPRYESLRRPCIACI